MAKKERSAEDVVKGGGLVLLSGLVAGVFGWLWGTIASRSDIGFGAAGYGIWSMANAIVITLMSITGGFHSAFSKKISESLVTSNELAKKYTRAGFKITQLFGITISIPLFILSFYLFLIRDNLMFAIILTISITTYLLFLRDNFIGTLGGIQRFDLIAIVNFMIMVGSISIGFIIIFFVPSPENATLSLITIFSGPVLQIVVELVLLKKALPFSLKSSIFGKTDKKILNDALKYGLYCILPMIILNGSIFTLQTLFYSIFFRPGGQTGIAFINKLYSILVPESNIIGISAIFIGYAGIMNSISIIAWPIVPALSEAKALNNEKLIDDYVRSTFKAGFNLTSFFIIIFIGLSYSLLLLLHGPEYSVSYIPFIIQSVAVAITGIDFLIAATLIGLGEGRKASVSIGALLISQIILIPTFIILFKSGNSYNALYAGPIALLIASGIILALTFKYLTKLTRNSSNIYLSILAKGSFSSAVTIIISLIIENFIYPYSQSFTSFLIGAVIVGGIYLLLMLFLAGYDEEDFKLIESFGPMRGFAGLARKISKLSPFYKTQSKLKNLELNENE